MPKQKKPIILLKQQVIWIISSAFAIAAALFWKDAIEKIVKLYVPPAQEPIYAVYIATIVTVIAIVAVFFTHKILKE